MEKKSGLILFLLYVFFISSFIVSAQEKEFNHVISNSGNWRDVYSVMHYATLKGVGSDFLVSPRHGPLLLNGLSKTTDIRVFSSSKQPFIINFDDIIRDAGFSDADEVVFKDANLELIKDLPEIQNFIIVGNTYGYNPIAVASYAVLNKAWIFFADRVNIDEIDLFLSSRQVDEVLIYGFVDREVRDALEKYNPEIIDSGDKFEDNTLIVDKYMKINSAKQVILTNGEFIEKEIMSGAEPVLFTGKENVPDKISNYIKNSDIEVGVLIGADLVGAATNIRRGTGISVIVKFARGARAPTGAVAAVEGLDLFYLPIPIMNLDLHSARYNRATSQLELTYKSNSNIPIFFRGTVTPITESGEKTRVGDIEPIFIAPNDFKTVSYPGIEFTEDKLSVEVFTLYGDTPKSLEKILEKRVDVEFTNIIDKCEIEIEGIKYSKSKKSFIIKIGNLAEFDCWVDVELSDIFIDGTKKTLGSDGSIKIPPGKKRNIIIKQEMIDEDLDKNKFVNIIAYFGEREDGLVKIFQGKFELKIELISLATIGFALLILIVLIALIVLIVIFFKRRKEKNDDW